MQKYILTLTLNPAVDETVRISRFKTGKDFLADESHRSAGGKGINVSRVLKQLKVPTVACGFLAGPAGNYIRESLKREKIRHAFISVSGNTRISLTVIDPVSKKATRILNNGPAVTAKDVAQLSKEYNRLLSGTRLVVLSGRNAHRAETGLYARLIRAAKRKDIPVLLDTHGAPLAAGIKAKPDFISPNREEAEGLLRKKIVSRSSMIAAVKFFLRKGVVHVMISLGAQGAIGSDGEDIWLARAPKIKAKNTVGSGDAFNGGFIYAYLKRKPFAVCLQNAVAAGTANTLGVVPGKIDIKKMKQLFSKVQLQKL